jgi:hypothetical protein
MRRVWGHGVVDRRLSIKGIRDEISWVWNPTAYKAFLAMLSGLGNPEACFLSRIKAFFTNTEDTMISGAPPRVGVTPQVFSRSC